MLRRAARPRAAVRSRASRALLARPSRALPSMRARRRTRRSRRLARAPTSAFMVDHGVSEQSGVELARARASPSREARCACQQPARTTRAHRCTAVRPIAAHRGSRPSISAHVMSKGCTMLCGAGRSARADAASRSSRDGSATLSFCPCRRCAEQHGRQHAESMRCECASSRSPRRGTGFVPHAARQGARSSASGGPAEDGAVVNQRCFLPHPIALATSAANRRAC